MRLVACLLLLAAAAAGGVEARPAAAGLAPPLAELVLAVDRATPGARRGDPELAQARYDAARALAERIGARTAATCAERGAHRYAIAAVRATERFDRLLPTDAGERAVTAARTALARGACPGTIRPERVAVQPLPAQADVPARAPRLDAGLGRRLAATTRGFDSAAAAWVHDLRTGRAAGSGETTPFPAASTVKLGVLVAGLDRFGPRPERSPVAHDLAALTGWSSNLAANRLLRLLGGGDERRGVQAVEDRLRRLGAAASTYPGAYRAGTVRALVPPVTGRVTTARDLGRVLVTLHAAAAGNRAAGRRAGLTQHEARVGLGLLLASERTGDNAGILGLAARVPAAQKHGWTSSTRHSAALVYAPAGPVVVVALTYRRGIDPAGSRRFGARVGRIALG
ncbi:MAG TPA: serine hydrolase [Gaiellaceae bacterium]|nr:serine hydrolase [Gaiellaceae bacterium]